jgi:hypothetical protein
VSPDISRSTSNKNICHFNQIPKMGCDTVISAAIDNSPGPA